MKLDLDTLIFVSFLAINLVVGLFYSRGVKSTVDYAIGDRKFSTSAITTTIVATCVGGGLFSTALAESYREGLYFIIPIILGDLVSLTITGYFLIPRMIELFGALSVAEAMGRIYGKYARIITAISGIFLSTGIVALQFKVAGSVMQLFFGVSSFYATLLTAIVVITYSSFGGIKAVTFTDILQFAVFGVVIPLICVTIWWDTPLSIMQVFDGLSNNPLFDYKEVLNIENPRLMSLGFLVLVFIIPALDPAFFQRVSMSKSVMQAQKSFISAALIIAFITILICWTAILLLFKSPDLNPDNLLPYIIDTYAYPGLKGIAAIGIIATIMSTADSYINSATVMLEYDLIGVLTNRNIVKLLPETLLLKLTALFIGSVALYVSYDTGTMQQIFLKMLSFYMPIVSVPLLIAIFGFRSNGKVALMGMAAGALTVILWSALYDSDDSVIPSMTANAITFIIAHNIFGRPEGLVSEEYALAMNCLSQKRRHDFNSFLKKIKNFNFLIFCKNNFPVRNSLFVTVGLFSLISTYSTLHFTSHEIQSLHSDIYKFVYQSTLICGFVIMIYPILSPKLKYKNIMPVLFIISSSYAFVFAPMLLVIVSHFAPFQIVIFLINLLAFSCFMQWQTTLLMLTLSVFSNINFYNLYASDFYNPFNEYDESIGWQFKVIYILLLSSIALLAFLKPRQEAQELSHEVIDHLSHTVEDQNNQISELSGLKQTFLRNLQHETNTPITGIYSMSQALQDCYDKLTDQQRKNSIDTIVTSSERLISYANNLIDISKLTNQSYNLKLREVNLSNLLEECIRKCKRLYIPKESEENREFEIIIEPNLKTTCDEYYIRKSFENLLVNAVQYCKKGKIFITLTKIKNSISLAIKDSGIGIPKEELKTIFNPFTTSSKITTPAGGRGLGLASVKAAAEVHGATVTAESDGENGSTFTMILPAKM